MGGEGDDRGWDGWMASPIQWTWVWVNSRRWWWTGRPDVLRFMGLQRVEHNWATELNWTDLKYSIITADSDCSHEIKKTLAPWKESYDKSRQHIKKQRHYFAQKGPSSQDNGFSSSHVWMWELDYKERWVLRNWCFWSIVLEKTLESPLDCKEI